MMLRLAFPFLTPKSWTWKTGAQRRLPEICYVKVHRLSDLFVRVQLFDPVQLPIAFMHYLCRTARVLVNISFTVNNVHATQSVLGS